MYSLLAMIGMEKANKQEKSNVGFVIERKLRKWYAWNALIFGRK